MAQLYEGFYARFSTVSKTEGSLLMGADNIVGDDYEIFFKKEEDRYVAWLKNKFGAEVGYLDTDTSRRLQLAHARDMVTRAFLSFVAFSDTPDPGIYWGEMAIISFNPAYEKEISAFCDRVASRLAEGVRPAIDLGSQAVQKMLDDPEWMPTETIPLPTKEKGMAIMKDRQSFSEKMIEQGRARNIGCYIVSWAFVGFIIAGLIYVAHVLGLF